MAVGRSGKQANSNYSTCSTPSSHPWLSWCLQKWDWQCMDYPYTFRSPAAHCMVNWDTTGPPARSLQRPSCHDKRLLNALPWPMCKLGSDVTTHQLSTGQKRSQHNQRLGATSCEHWPYDSNSAAPPCSLSVPYWAAKMIWQTWHHSTIQTKP